jgi:FMN phosphatase YigB (HAD superfamily)
MSFKLICLDVDRTLVPFNSIDIYPAMAKRLKELREEADKNHELLYFALVSNQGGPACHDAGWGNSSRQYPEYNEVLVRLQLIKEDLEAIVDSEVKLYTCFAYKGKDGTIYLPEALKSQRNTVNWEYMRKPGPGMIEQAMADFKVNFTETLMVGDSVDDQGAAEAARVTFMWVTDFICGPMALLTEDLPTWADVATKRVVTHYDALGQYMDILIDNADPDDNDHFYWVATAKVMEIRAWAEAKRLQQAFDKDEVAF